MLLFLLFFFFVFGSMWVVRQLATLRLDASPTAVHCDFESELIALWSVIALPDSIAHLHLSICVFNCSFSSFHLRLSCSVRPLGVLFLGLFSYWLYWTRCSYRVVLTPQLREKLESWLHRAVDWRHNSPSMFCLVSSGCLATIAVLGHLLSGSVLVMTLLVVSAVVSTKYNFKLVNIERRGKCNPESIFLLCHI